MGSKRLSLLYKDKPLFGLDVGTGSLKIMQIATENKKRPAVLGYAAGSFDASAVEHSEIIDPKVVAKAILDIFKHDLIGDISSHRIAMSIPAAKTFTREMQLPAKLSRKELDLAAYAEAEQYIPRPLDELYLDYTINGTHTDHVSAYLVAVPRKIVDSYYALSRLLGLEAVFIEPSISAAVRLLMLDEQNRMPSVLVDFGTRSADISIFDTHVVVTGTVSAGGDLFTEQIMRALKVTREEAVLIKTKYGLGLSKKQAEITEALKPLLDEILREIRRMVRYYEDRSETEHKISQVITMGGGANMPGLSDYLTASLRMPTRMSDPWQMLDFGKLKPPNYEERSIYMTVAGLALTPPKEIFS